MTDAASRSLARPRWAGPDDDAALVDLVRACPMSGSVRMYFDRAPSFFTLSALQGDGAHVCVLDDRQPGRLSAAAALASFPEVYVDGMPREVFYACDLRVHPESRGGRQVKRLYDFLTDWGVNRGWDLGVTTILKDNAAMAGVLQGKGSLLPYHHVTTLRNFTVQFLFRKRPPRGITVRRATEADVPQMIACWNRVQSGKQFAPVWSEASFRQQLERSPGLSLERYYLAFRDGRLVGLLATWDQEAFKRMVVLGYAPEMARMRRWYNPLSRLLGLARMPEAGQAMPYFYATQVCAEEARDLEALLVAVYNDHKSPRYLFISAMLDVRDPLIQALDGFMTQAVDIEFFVMDPLQRWGGHPFNARPIYFDHSLV